MYQRCLIALKRLEARKTVFHNPLLGKIKCGVLIYFA